MKTIYKIIPLLTLIVLLGSCNDLHDLEETPYSTLDSENFYQNEDQAVLAMLNAYTQLQYRGTSLWGIMGTQVVTTDEAVIPYREQGAFLRNNGIWLALHRHNFFSNLFPLQAAWDYSFDTIAAANQVIYQIEEAPDFDAKESMVAELKVLRAYAYYVAMDQFGNIPVTLDFTDTSLPDQYNREEVFEIVEQEVIDNLELLDAEPTQENYGRATQGMAYALLAKMYLNAEVYTGDPMWEEAIEMCDNIIDSGYYSLENDYFSNFSVDNINSGENIFVIPYDRKVGFAFQMHQITLHPSFSSVYNYSTPIWNGMSATEAHYNLYDSDDDRINSWMVGPQLKPNGQPLTTSTGDPLEFTPEVSSLDNAGEGDGVRAAKWEFPRDLQSNESMDNDWAIFRYADILLMKAEAIMRMNGGNANQEAMDLVNEVRERAFGNSDHNYTTGTLTLDELLNERSRELAWEGHRRQDLIRFGKWDDSWFAKPGNIGDHTEIFPIPSNYLSANPNLQQNPGY